MDNIIALKEIHLANEKNRDANVRFVSLVREPNPTFSYKNKPIQNIKLLINDEQTNEQNLQAKFKNKLADEIINNDVDIDVEFAGKIVGDIDRIFLNSKSEILYHPPKIKEIVFNKKGEEVKTQKPSEIIPNVRDDTPPLKWTGKYFKREEVLQKFVFSKSIQLKHVDGLTFEFLFEMAKKLDEKKSLILLGGGKTGKDPLIFQSNGLPHRGFLDGRVKGKEYQLMLRLSNLELKRID